MRTCDEVAMISQTPKKRIFVCYDLVNDSKLLDFIIAQSRQMDSPFVVIDYSRNWEPPEKLWKEKLKRTISLVELVFIMVGKKTYKATNVLEEVDIAYNLSKPIMQFSDPEAKFSECKPITKAGRLYQWEWENLKGVMQKLNTYRKDRVSGR
jgi:hypothetical protein